MVRHERLGGAAGLLAAALLGTQALLLAGATGSQMLYPRDPRGVAA